MLLSYTYADRVFIVYAQELYAMLKRILLGIGLLLGLLIALLVGRALMFPSKQITVKPVTVEVDAKEVAGRLAEAVRFKTISHQDPKQFDPKPFLALHAFMQKSFPNAHKVLTREVINQYSLLYTWKGSDTSLPPVVLMGHMDVVPVQKGTEKDWKHPPYSGKLADGAIWGRGTLDDKVAVIGLMEAAEFLAKKGFQPTRTIYFAFGHDEEIGGNDGAKKIAELLAKRKVKAAFVVDEGMAVTHGIMAGLGAPMALIGLAEKGYVTVRLKARSSGGHSSMPPRESAAGILSRAVLRLEKNPMPARIVGATRQLLNFVGPEMNFGNKLVISNLWLLEGVLRGILEKKPSTNATLRTTTAVTILRAGVKDNVLPITAEALVNFRILPGDSVQSVVAHVKKVINDKRVKVDKGEAGLNKEPSPVSDTNTKGFVSMHKSIRQVFHKAKVAPGLVLGGTDSRHFINVSQQIYRFLPIEVTSKDLKRLHGTNERITVSNYAKAVQFYIQLLRNVNGK